jgi:hypothetical protein
MQSHPQRSLRAIYADICRGYSIGRWKDEPVYIRHLTQCDHSEADEYGEQQLEKARSRGVSTKKEKEAWLIKTGQWSQKDDMDLLQQADYIKGLKVTLSKAALHSQIQLMKKSIEEETKRYNELFEKKEKLFGTTADSYSLQKVQFFYVYLAFYRDAGLEQRFFSLKAMEDLHEDESYDLLSYYINFIGDFSIDRIRRLSLADFFTNTLALCDEDMGSFFRKPMWKLSVQQTNLLSSGRYFASITSGENIPPDIKGDPDKIEEYLIRARNMKDLAGRVGKDGGSVGLIGATKEDFAALGAKDDRSFLQEGSTSLLATMNSR